MGYLGLDKPILNPLNHKPSIAEEDAESITSPTSKVSKNTRKTNKSIASKSNLKDGQSVKTMSNIGEKKKHVVLDEGKAARVKGKLKFFTDDNNYGFITVEDTQKDIFVHFGDLNKAGLTKKELLDSSNWNKMRFEFTILTYIGGRGKSKKAVDLTVIN